ncbi:MAG: peptide chain release factor N(5)-glutamine methyltransferase [Calditrichaeota bacterium]|nr:peptide chain release factor N(5)-glutamine methyltransferase [Calditrichota bacterium]RQV92599.1 MAG: peptide chain release factor N(5)-glutamine methyltransferase [bacterium]RQV99768.1 MAG: peptide chain release factor N(5)-glutamine methyltransferase [Calditrichota bacterium]
MQEIWTIQKLLNWTIDYFQSRDVPEARLSAELLLSGALNMKRLDLYLQFERILTTAELDRFREYVKRRAKYEPVQYILGEQNFMGLIFRVNPDVLIPRPETELLVEAVLNEISSRSSENLAVLDVGTGSGAIAISLAHFCRECRIIANDISSAALETARRNARLLSTENIQFIQCQATELPEHLTEKCDVIVSNPPYVPEKQYEELHPQVKNFEPAEALKGGPDGLDFYRSFIPVIPRILKRGGLVFLEIGFNQKEKIQDLLSDSGVKQLDFIQDYQKINRIVKVIL